MNRIKQIFNKLTASDHFLIFLIILFLLKSFSADSGNYLHIGIEHLIIGFIWFLPFKYGVDRSKSFQNATISIFIIILIMQHTNLNMVTGFSVFVFTYIAKFFINKSVSYVNPVVFALAMVSMLSFITPFYLLPAVDFNGVTHFITILSIYFPLAIVPLVLSILINGKRLKRSFLSEIYFATATLVQLSIHQDISWEFILSQLFVAAILIIEPKTSPVGKKQQAILGVSVAVCVHFFVLKGVPNGEVFAILIGNIGYYLFRKR